MKKIILWYSSLYPYIFGLLVMASMAYIYCLSSGHVPNTDLALVCWIALVLMGLSSFMCKKKLRNTEIEK